MSLPVLAIAWNSFEEARHNKVLYIAIGFFLAIGVLTYFLAQGSLSEDAKVIKDLGLATISLFGIFVAIYLSVNTLYHELEHRTVYVIISKPIDRFEFVMGKYLGMALVLFAVTALMTLFLVFWTAVIDSTIDLNLLKAVGLSFAESLIVAAFGIVFSSFSSPFLSGFFTFGIFIIGRVSYELGQFGARSDNALFKFVATGVQKVYDLEAFNVRTEVVHDLPLYAEDFWWPLLYALFAVSLLVLLSILIFHKRDFK